MPLFKVSMTVEALIYAADEKSAKLDGLDALGQELGNRMWHEVDAYPAKSRADLPKGWTMDALVYHDGLEDLTVADALAGNVPAEGA